jgi:hypothetical protein
MNAPKAPCWSCGRSEAVKERWYESRVSNKYQDVNALGGLRTSGAFRTYAQSEIDPEHFEFENAKPFKKAVTKAIQECFRSVRERARHEAKYLFVCAGDQARTNPDFLAVLNFEQGSRDYGKVIATSPLPNPGATGNEFQHIGLSADGKVVACGGLLSVLKGQKEIFFWDVSDPDEPRFISAADPPLSAITDEFHALPHGGFLVTMMGGARGHAPGRVAEFDRNLNLIKEFPDEPPRRRLQSARHFCAP